MRRTLDILLQQNGGANLVSDPQVRKVVLSLLDYVQGNTDPDHKTHYDLLAPIGRMAAADQNKSQFGTRFIALPNPMYGDWENAIYDYNFKLSSEEKRAKRRALLRD